MDDRRTEKTPEGTARTYRLIGHLLLWPGLAAFMVCLARMLAGPYSSNLRSLLIFGLTMGVCLPLFGAIALSSARHDGYVMPPGSRRPAPQQRPHEPGSVDIGTGIRIPAKGGGGTSRSWRPGTMQEMADGDACAKAYRHLSGSRYDSTEHAGVLLVDLAEEVNGMGAACLCDGSVVWVDPAEIVPFDPFSLRACAECRRRELAEPKN